MVRLEYNSFVCETKVSLIGEDQVIEQTNIHPFERFFQLSGEANIRLTGFEVAAGMIVSCDHGRGAQIEYEDQDPKIHEIFLEAMKKAGAKSLMGQFIDESKYNI